MDSRRERLGDLEGGAATNLERTGGHWPTFLVIGAAKSGTTALHHYLGQHPDVFLPKQQEPSFFSFEGARPSFGAPEGASAAVNFFAVTELHDYLRLFDGGAQCPARGEVSTIYMYWPGTAERIRQHVPEAKLCAVLRNPVDRAYSAFMHAMREGKEPLGDFAAALEAEADRIQADCGPLWRYADLGFYSRQLVRFYDVFPASQIKIILYDDLLASPDRVCAELYEFIGVDPGWVPDMGMHHNVSGLPRSRVAQRLLGGDTPIAQAARVMAPLLGAARLRRWRLSLQRANVRRVPFPASQRGALLGRFADDIDSLQRLIGRDLSHWGME